MALLPELSRVSSREGPMALLPEPSRMRSREAYGVGPRALPHQVARGPMALLPEHPRQPAVQICRNASRTIAIKFLRCRITAKIGIL